MASYPPPYPPPAGSPYGYDARQQARMARQQMKAQARAQKATFRVQRQMYQQQARAMRRSSILGPLLVVAVGVTLLLIRLGKVPFYEFANLFGRWWPMLFVAAGIVLLLEWAFDQHSHNEGVPFVRRGIGGGVVFLLILLSIAGACFSVFHDGGTVLANGLHFDGSDLGEFLGDRHDFEQEVDQPFTAGMTLNVSNPHGDVTISGKSGDDKVHVVLNKQVYAYSGNASSLADELSPLVTTSGGEMRIEVPAINAAHADLAITLPDFGQTTVIANHGDVSISDMQAPINVTANHGDIELDRIRGPLTVHVSNNGTTFSAHGIRGDVTLRGHADDLNLTEISGAVSLEGEFFGDTHLEHLSGPVAFRTSRTQLTLGSLEGTVDISPNEELTGNQMTGPIELRTRSRNISLERVAGSVDVINSHGTVDLTSAAPLGNVSIENPNGAVTVTVPEHVGVTIDTQAKEGAIRDDIDNVTVPENAFATHTATMGDGAAHLLIHNTHADITIHQGLVEPPSPPSPPAPPVPAASPSPSSAAKAPTVKHRATPRSAPAKKPEPAATPTASI